jgi:hypothetical protein
MSFDLATLAISNQPITLVNYAGASFVAPAQLNSLLSADSYAAGWRLTNTGSAITAAVPEPATVGLLLVVAGFTPEYVFRLLGGRFRPSYRPLNNGVIEGRLRGVAGVVGCCNPNLQPMDTGHVEMVKELIRRCSRADAVQALDEAMKLTTAEEIDRHLRATEARLGIEIG